MSRQVPKKVSYFSKSLKRLIYFRSAIHTVGNIPPTFDVFQKENFNFQRNNFSI